MALRTAIRSFYNSGSALKKLSKPAINIKSSIKEFKLGLAGTTSSAEALAKAGFYLQYLFTLSFECSEYYKSSMD